MTEPEAVEATPRSEEDIATLEACPEVVSFALERDVAEVVHFTTKTGAVGILASRAIKSRKRLPKDKYLEHIYRPNAQDRSRDFEWHDYVNLSITRINDWLFSSSQKWHRSSQVEWVIFAFEPEILGHPGVVFTTTNNAYPNCSRAEGLVGIERIFASHVSGHNQQIFTRSGIPENCPSDRRAEVLYPGELNICHIKAIYTRDESTLDDMSGILGVLNLTVPITYFPEAFR